MAKSKDKKKNKTAVVEEERNNSSAEKETPENLNVKIKAIAENPEQKTSPIIGYFPFCYDPRSGSTDPDSGVKVYVNPRNPKNPRMQLVVGSSRPKLNLVGTSYSGEATAPQLCNYALGVLDKETGVLKMVPVAANRIFKLAPKFNDGSRLTEIEAEDEANEEITKEERERKLKNLAKYETKKNNRRDNIRDTIRQAEDTGTQKDFDQKLKRITIKAEALASTTNASTINAQNVPPYDLDATTPDMAYPLDKIILKGEWDYLLDIFELAQAGGEVAPDHYPSFVRHRVGNLRDIKDESRRRRMAGVLSYITHLIKFKDRHSMDGVSSAKHHRFPNILTQKFSSMFGSTNERRIPDDKQKLLINYVLVLSLIADDFRSNPSDIAKDLRMNPITLRDHYGYLGCKLVRENQVTLATLPVPLKFETMKRKRRR